MVDKEFKKQRVKDIINLIYHLQEKIDIYEFISSHVFNLTTYDLKLDQLFVEKIIEVLKVILNRETFEYIKKEDNYINYILVCQKLEQLNWIDWGTSIRGAFLDESNENATSICEYYYNDYQYIIKYSKENLIAFIEWYNEKINEEK